MNSYLIHEKKILLYGAATRGNILLDIFQRKGYQVTAFVDQRAHEIKTYCDLPVYTISELSTRISGKSEYAVYIDLKNVFEHDSVALELFNAGFKNLIFRPGRVLLGTGNEQELSLNDIYDILVDEHADSRCSILPVDTIRFPQIKDFSLLHETSDGHCIIKVPCVLVFSDLEKRTSKWEDISIYGLYPHIALFENFAGKNNDGSKTYIEMCESAARKKQVDVTDQWRSSVLKNRSEVYDRMQLSYDFDLDFFERNAVDAKWNNNGYFNICSGKHRCTFLISKGTNYIILKVCKADHQKLFDSSKVQAVLDYIIANKLLQLHAPIEYPLFFNYPCRNYEFYYGAARFVTYTFTRILFESMQKESFKNTRVYIRLNDDGFLKRHFLRMGALVSHETPGADHQLEHLLDNLFQTNAHPTVTPESVYDFAVIDNTTPSDSTPAYRYAIIIDSAQKQVSDTDCSMIGTLCRNGQLLYLYLKK